ncbi:hypothetical protein L7E55_17075 [Pelotomaculum isophthalicicum JI]|uniref:Uncharacterized protein n=1 Tax=Pelotomaculum isophthalicicum JI TaxID=947010 RepID=A0A9X4JUX7_9FIRM|nr:hypothetical protein [Pelotomaculum isophthalicicum]MDF9410030.1 hypothetical protein [Pelotomaculum isophthalicicum JI]
MKKKYLVVLCAVLSVLMFALPVMASAETMVQGSNQKTFSKDTVITEDNVNDILRCYGLDPNSIIKKDNMPNVKVTVGDLENALKEFSKMPKKVVLNNDNPTNVKVIPDNQVKPDGLIRPLSSGTQTCFYEAHISSSLTMNYYATGYYYHEGSTKYWTAAGPANITVGTPASTLYFYSLDSVTTLTNQVVNPYTSGSYLHMEYCYAVGHYMFVGVGYIRIGSQSVSGSTNFNSSYIP